MTKTHDILIVEDRPEIRDRLLQTVEATPGLRLVGDAGTLDQALGALFDLKPRVVLVDLGLPDGSGADIITAAAGADWPCDSIVISIFGDEARVIEAIQAGAKGYILKGDDLANLGRDILAVIDGGSPISPAIARHLLTIVRTGPSGGPSDPENDTILSDREMEILRAVARGFKRKEIADRLGITQGTVGNHIHSVYRKLGVGSNTQAVARAARLGLL